MMAFKDSGDKGLVQKCKKGDLEAFRDLFLKYQVRVYNVAYGILRNREDAMEVSQDAFVKAYKSIKRFRGNSSFGTWLFRITINQAIDFHRRNRKRKIEDNILDREHLFWREEQHIFEHAENPEDVIARKEFREELGRALTKLSPKQRMVIVLREMEGLSYHEISGVLGCPKGTVMSRLHGARVKLRELLKRYFEQ